MAKEEMRNEALRTIDYAIGYIEKAKTDYWKIREYEYVRGILRAYGNIGLITEDEREVFQEKALDLYFSEAV